jgi:hypothetical protein
MRVTIEIPPYEARAFVKYLNDDEGMRNAAAQQLLGPNKPVALEQMTAIVNTLGAISRGFVLALATEGKQG